MKPLTTAMAMLFISFMVGIVGDPIFRRSRSYERLSSLYLFRDLKTYERLGVLWFRKFLACTPFGWLNQSICITKERDLGAFRALLDRMAAAEMSHWVAFVAMLGMTAVAWAYRGWQFGVAGLAVNVLGNLYPCWLQQYNKRRLLKHIAALERRAGASNT
jgi:hypothetical protein